MASPAIAFRTVSFVLTSALVWLAYPVLAGLVYVGLLIASASGDQGMGGPLAGPLLVLLGAVVGALCVAMAAPPALAARAISGIKGVVAGAVILLVLVTGVIGLVWVLADVPGNPVVAGVVLFAATAPAMLVVAVSDVVARLVTRGLAVRTQSA